MTKKLIVMIAALVAAVAIHAEEPARQEIEDAVHVYTHRVAQQQDRLDTVEQKLMATDEQIERRVGRVVALVTKVTDSESSKTKVTRAKQDLFEAIRKNIEFYGNERGRRFAELYRPHTPDTKAALAADVKWLNDRIEKRIDQALALVVSLPVEKDLAKSTTHYGDGSKTVEANPAYTQQRRVSGVGGQMRNDACTALKAGIERLKRSNAELERALTYAKTDEGRAFVKELMAHNNELIGKRGDQIEAARLQASSNARPLASKAADALRDQLEDERDDNKKDFSEWNRLKSERDTERARLLALRNELDRLRQLLAAP